MPNRDNDLTPVRVGPPVGTDDPTVRAWVILLLDAVSRTGISPISKLRFHRLAYFTNCLSQLFDLTPSDSRIVKFRRGPFYPVLQWHLDRLVGSTLAKMSGVRHFSDASGSWMDAQYAIDHHGVALVQRMAGARSLDALAAFLLEASKAYASQSTDSLDDVILADVTYDHPGRAVGAVIDFAEARDNLSVQAANAFDQFVVGARPLTPGDELHLYMEYLDRLRARQA